MQYWKMQWLATNAGPAWKGESKEYEMQGVIPNPLNIQLFLYALYNRNLQHEDSLR